MTTPKTPVISAVRLGRHIGRGGAADIWTATVQLPMGMSRPCALKRLRDELVDRPEYRHRFRRELEIGLAVTRDHPNLVTTDGAEIVAGAPALILELVEGPPLAHVHEDLRHWHAIRCIAHDLLSALGYLAARGVLHRDVSMGNVLLDREGRVRLGDFGLATWAEGDSCLGEEVGTEGYRAPETLSGGRYSAASDLYSLGRVLWELCTGDLEAKHLPDDTPSDLREVIRGLLIERPRRRWSAERALARLQPTDWAVAAAAAAEISAVAREWLAARATAGKLEGIGADGNPTARGPSNAPALVSSRASVDEPDRRRDHLRWLPGMRTAAIAAAALLVGSLGTLSLVESPREDRATTVQPGQASTQATDTTISRSPLRAPSVEVVANESITEATTQAAVEDERVRDRDAPHAKEDQASLERATSAQNDGDGAAASRQARDVSAMATRTSESERAVREQRTHPIPRAESAAVDDEGAEIARLLQEGGRVFQTPRVTMAVTAGDRRGDLVMYELASDGRFTPVEAIGFLRRGGTVDVQVTFSGRSGHLVVRGVIQEHQQLTIRLRDAGGMDVYLKELITP
ncbi:serine/threonine-protein kinase [Haliangium sp.]|uniref:serine/threonine-protein kinase n=1 Tax=Haliangium sp. TaxID=2663208 RepID=UPI003D0E2A99